MTMSSSTRPWAVLRQYLKGEDEESCQACIDRLYIFVSEEAAGRPVDKLYPEIAQHIDCCPTCLAQYELLANLFQAILYGDDL